MLPLFLVYYFEYLINQSMFFPAGLAVSAPGKAHISTACHTYSTLQFLYQLGVLVSRSSTSVFRISTLWPLPVLQGLNAGAMLLLIVTLGNAGGGSGGAETRWLVWLLVVWEGLLGGATYVNAFTNLSEFTSAREREFAMGITSLADSIGICLAALSSLHLEPALLRMMGISGAIHC
uniref:Battenin n=1 Tax=Tetraselmis chuii TaxID=63592 RepID=A0A7S1SIY3_9CHLO|mmetsp:Transcript_14727/g.26034  ORF Transcript_14727/g.26034 Transcript_14727/m.26034 type:complete len:177 (+) Transcript_14727:1018-1548(+)